jgi:hypothetical protein
MKQDPSKRPETCNPETCNTDSTIQQRQADPLSSLKKRGKRWGANAAFSRRINNEEKADVRLCGSNGTPGKERQ